MRDNNESKQKELELQQKVERDLLTGLYNKGTTELLIKDFLSLKKATHNISAFIIVDLDNFKTINNLLGHAFGDAVLSETAHHLQLMCQDDDIVGRIGGDEFVLFLKKIPNRNYAEEIAKSICQMFCNAYEGMYKDCKISGTVGIAFLPEHGTNFEALYEKAELALYAAKNNGKDTYCLYDDFLWEEERTHAPHAKIDRSTGKTFAENMIEYVFRILYESRDIHRAVTVILELVSKHFHFSRGYIYEAIENGGCRRTFEWCKPGVSPFIGDTMSGAEFVNYKHQFDQDGLFVLSSLDSLRENDRFRLEQQNVKSHLQFALTSNKGIQGFIGFDHCTMKQTADMEQFSVLQGVAQILDVFLEEKRTNDKLVESSTMLQMVIDSLDTCTYIMDPETFQLRFVNPNTNKRAPKAVVGACCYETIHNYKAPCKNCAVISMIHKDQKTCRTEIYDETYHLWSKLDAFMITLSDHKQYGLVNCYDITQYKNQSGEYIVNADAFTRDTTLYDALSRSTDDYIYMCDMPKDLYYFPKTMVEEFDLPGQVVPAAASLWGSLIHENERADFFQAFDDLITGKTNIHCQDYRVRNRQGEWIWLRCRGYLEHDMKGKPSLFSGIITKLGKRGKIDHLTGLPNKYEFEKQVNIQRSRKDGGAVLLLGMDNFKYINNLYGWDFGDQVIRITSQKIQSLLPGRLQVYRLDGDWFGIIFPSHNEQGPEEVYHKLRTVFQQHQEYGGHRYYCTISGGYTTFDESGVEFNVLIKRMESALEYSKSDGKDRLSRFDAELMSNRDRALSLIELLRESVENGFKDFELYYQPQVDAKTCKIKSAEALLRWKCEKYGVVSPVEFVPLLERTGLIQPVGRWVIEQAAHTCKGWRKLLPGFTMSVNLSYMQFLDENFISHIVQTMQFYSLQASALHLELTESRIADRNTSFTNAFARLRALGYCIEMDDFGTGYSSLEVLKNAPADVVKIDRVFVKDITHSDFDATFIQFVVSICHSVGIKVCLEGIETWEEYEIVKTMGLEIIQGFLFGKPQCKSEFESMYLAKRDK